MNLPGLARRYLPILDWGAKYTSKTFTNDLIVAAIVTIMLIPQSLAYALLVGLSPQVGLYASMAPLVLYAIFGTSHALAVGPVSVASLMTAAAVEQVAAQGTPGKPYALMVGCRGKAYDPTCRRIASRRTWRRAAQRSQNREERTLCITSEEDGMEELFKELARYIALGVEAG